MKNEISKGTFNDLVRFGRLKVMAVATNRFPASLNTTIRSATTNFLRIRGSPTRPSESPLFGMVTKTTRHYEQSIKEVRTLSELQLCDTSKGIGLMWKKSACNGVKLLSPAAVTVENTIMGRRTFVGHR